MSILQQADEERKRRMENWEPMELVAMRHAAKVVADWKRNYGPDEARRLVLEVIVVSRDPTWRAMYLTAFGQ